MGKQAGDAASCMAKGADEARGHMTDTRPCSGCRRKRGKDRRAGVSEKLRQEDNSEDGEQPALHHEDAPLEAPLRLWVVQQLAQKLDAPGDGRVLPRLQKTWLLPADAVEDCHFLE